MNRKIRLILFSFLVFLYLLVAPALIVYSLGYRVDFQNKKLVGTGGLYLKAWPQEVSILIDNKTEKKTGIFSNQMLIQGLFPERHDFLIQKDGYYPWQKTLEIKSKEVTRVENVTLIKKELLFDKIQDAIDYFSISPDNKSVLLTENLKGLTLFKLLDSQAKAEKASFEIINPKASAFNIIWSNDSSRFLIEKQNAKFPFEYFIFKINETGKNNPEQISFINGLKNPNLLVSDIAFSPSNPDELFFKQRNTLYLKNEKTSPVEEISPIIEKLTAYSFSGNRIIWLSESGYLFKSSFDGKQIDNLNENPFTLKENSDYKITAVNSFIFLSEDKNIFLFNEKTKDFEKFYDSVNDLKVSPHNDKILYFTDHEILVSDLLKPQEKVSVLRFSEDIESCFWINNDYLVFNVGKEIKISETDIRDKVNIVEIPTTVFLNDNSLFEIKNPKIYFDQTNKKLYIFDQNAFLASEPLTDKNNK